MGLTTKPSLSAHYLGYLPLMSVVYPALANYMHTSPHSGPQSPAMCSSMTQIGFVAKLLFPTLLSCCCSPPASVHQR